MDEYRRYLARQRHTRLLWAILAWTLVFLSGAVIMVVAWLALVGFLYVFGGRA
jgi:hypothetical protein